MTILQYYREHLAHVFGQEKADRVIENARVYSDPLCQQQQQSEGKEKNILMQKEGAARKGTECNRAEFEERLNNAIFPLVGLYRAMLLEGFTEQEVGSYLKALWDIAPDSGKSNF